MQKITTFLWFDGKAEEAANFYASVFKNVKVGRITRYDKASSEASGQPEGSAMTVEFSIEGMDFVGLNGGPIFKPNEAVSFQILCENQAEVDDLWSKLTADGGEESMCGWLKDKYGFSWQITPRRLMELLYDQDKGRSERAMQAMLQMQKIDIATLERAAEGKVAV
jgi:predicted 3-demethylubiquinone-9 3-methyltransferase (glyoxalase superfamily)